MPTEAFVVIALLAVGVAGWWHYRRTAKAALSQDEQDPSAPHDHARAHEMAKVQAELQRWSGPH